VGNITNVHEDLNNFRSTATKILEDDPISFIIKTVNRRHVGDRPFIALAWLSLLSARTGFRRLHLWSIGTSQKGKSDLYYMMGKIAPKGWIQIFPSISPKSLYYLTKNNPNALDEMVLFFDEVQASEGAIPLLRTLTSHTDIKPSHLSLDIQRKVVYLRIEGKQTVWFTSVTPLSDEQLTERFLFVNPDESETQDNAVFNLQDMLFRSGEKGFQDLVQDVEICRAMMEIIDENTKDVKVVIPYEIKWLHKSKRSLYPLFCTMIHLITKVHFMQREKDKDGQLVATFADFQIARLLWKAIYPYQTSKISQTFLDLLEQIPTGKTNAKTTTALDEIMQIGTRKIRYRAWILENLGLISSEKRDRRLYFWKRSEQSFNAPSIPSLNFTPTNCISNALSELLSSSSGKQAQNETVTPKEARINNEIKRALNDALKQKTSNS